MKRLLTAAVMIPVVLIAVFGGSKWLLLGVIALIAVLSYIEYSQILRIDMHSRLVGILAGIGILVIPPDRLLIPMLLFALIAVALTLRADDLTAASFRSAAMFLGIFYIFGSMKTAFLMGSYAPWLLCFALMLNWIGDSGAYYIGRRFGRHKLAPRISPGKSWEGALASVALSVVFFAVAMPRLFPVSWYLAALLAVAGNIAGQIGDLSESALKRGAGVKDSGNLLPGHGGMLDRVDSTFFTLPVIYSLVQWLHL